MEILNGAHIISMIFIHGKIENKVKKNDIDNNNLQF